MRTYLYIPRRLRTGMRMATGTAAPHGYSATRPCTDDQLLGGMPVVHPSWMYHQSHPFPGEYHHTAAQPHGHFVQLQRGMVVPAALRAADAMQSTAHPPHHGQSSPHRPADAGATVYHTCGSLHRCREHAHSRRFAATCGIPCLQFPVHAVLLLGRCTLCQVWHLPTHRTQREETGQDQDIPADDSAMRQNVPGEYQSAELALRTAVAPLAAVTGPAT